MYRNLRGLLSIKIRLIMSRLHKEILVTTKVYLLGRLDLGETKMISCGHSSTEVNDKLRDSIRMMIISNEMLSNADAENSPSYYVDAAQSFINQKIAENKLEIINLSAMREIFEGNKKISEFASEKTTTDTLKYWSCLWHIAKNNTLGLQGSIPSIDEIRWLVTDFGYYITVNKPTSKEEKSIFYRPSREENIKITQEFIMHFEVALKFGAPQNTLLTIAKIIKNKIARINESENNYDHLTTEELERKLLGRKNIEILKGVDDFDKFSIGGPSIKELEEMIQHRKSNQWDSSKSTSDFTISQSLQSFMKLVEQES